MRSSSPAAAAPAPAPTPAPPHSEGSPCVRVAVDRGAVGVIGPRVVWWATHSLELSESRQQLVLDWVRHLHPTALSPQPLGGCLGQRVGASPPLPRWPRLLAAREGAKGAMPRGEGAVRGAPGALPQHFALAGRVRRPLVAAVMGAPAWHAGEDVARVDAAKGAGTPLVLALVLVAPGVGFEARLARQRAVPPQLYWSAARLVTAGEGPLARREGALPLGGRVRMASAAVLLGTSGGLEAGLSRDRSMAAQLRRSAV